MLLDYHSVRGLLFYSLPDLFSSGLYCENDVKIYDSYDNKIDIILIELICFENVSFV